MSSWIPTEEIDPLQVTRADPLGQVFLWRGRVYRAINAAQQDEMRQLLRSGLPDYLAAVGMVPSTTLTDYVCAEASMVVEHRRIVPLIYPHEWTFSMLRAAALLVERIESIARDFGYTMRDCHPHNVVFDGLRPCYVDIGSFIRAEQPGWRSYGQFVEQLYYPLQLWQTQPQLARLLLLPGNGLAHEQYLLWRRPLFARLPQRLLQACVGVSVHVALRAEVHGLSRRERPTRTALKALVRRLAGLERFDRARLTERIAGLRVPRGPASPPIPAADAERLALTVARHAVGRRSLHIVGARSGLLLQRVIELAPQATLIGSDPDDVELDRRYRQFSALPDTARRLALAVFEPLAAWQVTPSRPPAERLTAEVVLVNADIIERCRKKGIDPAYLVGYFRRFAGTTLLLAATGDDAYTHALAAALRGLADVQGVFCQLGAAERPSPEASV